MAEIMIEFSMLYVRNPTQREFTSLRQLQRHAVGAVSAIDFSTQPPVPSSGRMVPVVPLSVPELRRLLNELVWNPLRSATFVRRWSTYRRYKQALSKRAHYRKRKSAPPEFQQLQL